MNLELSVILNVALLASMGLLGLATSGGMPGASMQAQDTMRESAAKLAPFAGIIGIVGLLLGILGLIGLLDLFGLISVVPVTVIVSLATVVVLILLGFLLAFPLIARVTGGAESAANAVARVRSIQRPLSILALILAVLQVVIYLLLVIGKTAL